VIHLNEVETLKNILMHHTCETCQYWNCDEKVTYCRNIILSDPNSSDHHFLETINNYTCNQWKNHNLQEELI
jgi:hypothetical protein